MALSRLMTLYICDWCGRRGVTSVFDHCRNTIAHSQACRHHTTRVIVSVSGLCFLL